MPSAPFVHGVALPAPLNFSLYTTLNWLQLLVVVKAAALKQQTSKFYPQIQRIASSHHIYFSQLIVMISVKASFCA